MTDFSVYAGFNRVWVDFPGGLLMPEVHGVKTLYPEWATSATRLGHVRSIGPYDGRGEDRSTTKHRPYRRSRELRRSERAAPGWSPTDLLDLRGAAVIISFNAIIGHLQSGKHGTENYAHSRLAELSGLPVALNQLRAWKSSKGWQSPPGERLVRIEGPGIGLDVVNSVYLLFEGVPLPLDAAGLDPDLGDLHTIAEYQVRAVYEK